MFTRILSIASRTLRMDASKVFRQGSWVISETMVTAISSFLVMVVMANILPKDVYGTYKYILALGAMLTTFSLTGLPTALTRAIAQGSDRSFVQGCVLGLRWSVGITVGATACALYYHFNNNDVMALGLLFAGIALPVIKNFQLYESYLSGTLHFKQKTIIAGLQQLFFGVLLASVAYFSGSVLVLVGTFFFSQALVYSVTFVYVLTTYRPRTNATPETFEYSKHLSAMSILSEVANQIDEVLTFHFLGAAQLATYTVALNLPKRLKGIFYNFSNIILPYLSTKDVRTIRKTVPHKVFLLFCLLSSVTLVYILSAPYIFTYLFPQYTEAVIYSQVGALTILFTSTMPFRQALLAHAQKRSLYISQISIPLCKILLTLILLPRYGIWGVVTALLLTRLYNSILYSILFMRMRL
ncbi:oligosaccharide flippase family protein [Candidatus Kaiserbacteria bacterium]|nr:oligosaccharide flippase family protein [Candidatus Kaiserbacteria bacterium]